MYAITVKQPWAEAIARFGKDCENRTRRPPAHLLGQRVAIHAGQAWDAWDRICAAGLCRDDHPSLPPAMLDWMDLHSDPRFPPHAGRIVATARLVGWIAPDGVRATKADAQAACYDGDVSVGDTIYRGWDDDAFDGAPKAMLDALDGKSPWAIASSRCQWILADVVALPEPVDEKRCGECPFGGYPKDDGNGVCICSGEPIRGQVYPFALSPEVEAEVLRQEAVGRASR